jgi:hypothetical protein
MIHGRHPNGETGKHIVDIGAKLSRLLLVPVLRVREHPSQRSNEIEGEHLQEIVDDSARHHLTQEQNMRQVQR